jgi:catechol 2,3-dioxygenase-like lactoylglutathione lyase family enzyme
MDLAHLGHLEMLTPKPEESLRFFIDVLGMWLFARAVRKRWNAE